MAPFIQASSAEPLTGKPAQIQFEELLAERLIFDAEVVRQNFHRFSAVLPRELETAHAAFDEGQHIVRTGFDFFIGDADAAARVGRHVIARVADAVKTFALQDQRPRRGEQRGGDATCS